MLSVSEGIPLHFDLCDSEVLANDSRPSSRPRNEPAHRSRISCNFRLSFGDGLPISDADASRHGPSESSADDLDKYDELFLACLPPCTDGSNPVAKSTVTDNSNLDNQHDGKRTRINECQLKIRCQTGINLQPEYVLITGNSALFGKGWEKTSRTLIRVHNGSDPVVDANWCIFRHVPRQVKPAHATITPNLESFPPKDTFCVATRKSLHIYGKDGESYAQTVSFPLRKLWPASFGLLIERHNKVAENLCNADGYPNLFCMTTHLDEPAPILFLGDDRAGVADYTTTLIRPDCSVAGTATDVPLVLIYDHAKSTHSLWLARPCTAEDLDFASGLLHNRSDVLGEPFFFHGESPLERNRARSELERGSSSYHADTFMGPSGSSPAVQSPAPHLRKQSLHRDVLLMSSGKYGGPHSSLLHHTPGASEQSSFNSNGSLRQPLPSPTSNDLILNSTPGLSFGVSPKKLFSSPMIMSADCKTPPRNRVSDASPNISAHALKRMRSNSSLLHSRTNSLCYSILDSASGRWNSKTGSGHMSNKRLRTHPTKTAPLSADELAYPKIAFMHIWSDSKKAMQAADQAFSWTSVLEETHFCYLMPTEATLRLIHYRMDEVDQSHMRITVVQTKDIPATSAVPIQSLSLILVSTPEHQFRLFATPNCTLLDVKFPAINPSVFVSLRVEPTVISSSPHVTSNQSRLMATPHLSPVQCTPDARSKQDSHKPIVLFACPGNVVGLETKDGRKIYRLPKPPSSNLIERFLVCIRDHVDRNVFLSVIKRRWIALSDAESGPVTSGCLIDDFFVALMSSLGFDVAADVVSPDNMDKLRNCVRRLTGSFMKKDSTPRKFVLRGQLQTGSAHIAAKTLMLFHFIIEEIHLQPLYQTEWKACLSWMATLAAVVNNGEWSRYYHSKLAEIGKTTEISVPQSTVVTSLVSPQSLLGSVVKVLSGQDGRMVTVKHLNDFGFELLRLGKSLRAANEKELKSVLTQETGQWWLRENSFLSATIRTAIQRRLEEMIESLSFEDISTPLSVLAGREDITRCRKVIDGAEVLDSCPLRREFSNQSKKLSKKTAHHLRNEMVIARFATDARIREAELLLNSWDPVVIPLSFQQSDNEVLFLKAQEAWLKSVAPRTMSLPVGRGMLCLRTEHAYATERISPPPMSYDGIECSSVRSIRKAIMLKQDDHPSGHELWPRFHNGVATGLKLRRFEHDRIRFDHHWLALNSSQMNKKDAVDYAGIFLGMALNNLIDANTDTFELHNLLVRLEDTVSIAVIIGMGCIKRRTQDKRYFRMIGLHISSFMTESGVELIIPPNIHVASLLSLGLLFMESGNRFVCERLLCEVATTNITESESAQHGTPEREAASLAAAYGLGFVLLGMGNQNFLGLADLQIPERLRSLMIGGSMQKVKTARGKTEESLINVHITAPGATIALAMIFMKTERKDVADWMTMPRTLEELDEIRPDFLILRVVAKSLIMWNTVEATEAWVNSNFPQWILKNVFLHSQDLIRLGFDVISITQAYFFILAGCAMSLGLKFAGTADHAAMTILMTMSLMMLKWSEDSSLGERCSQSLIQMCLTTILIALSSVMAGTGDLQVFRLLRYMHGRSSNPRPFTSYGHQMGVHMAIGLLFLGCGMYTVSTSNEALAAMLVAFFPIWPKHAADNRFHLQAFRHLYVLAVENRLLVTKSVKDGKPVPTKVQVFPKDGGQGPRLMPTPCVLPELAGLDKVLVASGRHILVFTSKSNWKDLRKLITAGGVYVYASRSLSDLGTSLDRSPNSLTAHFERNLYWPTSSSSPILESFQRFVKNPRRHCKEDHLGHLVELIHNGETWSGIQKRWLLWLVFLCHTTTDMDTFHRSVALALEKDQGIRDVAQQLMRRTSGNARMVELKSLLDKQALLERLSKVLESSGDTGMDTNEQLATAVEEVVRVVQFAE